MKNFVIEKVLCETRPENVEDFLEDKWLAEKGVGYPNVSVEQETEDESVG